MKNNYKFTVNCVVSLFFFVSVQTFAADSSSQSDSAPSFAWIKAPNRGEIAGKAHINLEGDMQFLGAQETSKFLLATGNLPAENEFTLANKSLGWFSIFNFTGEGYVKDDEKIDPDALLQGLKKNNEQGLEVRRQKNLPLIYLDGWHIAPRYDTETKQLEWATKLHNQDNTPIVNFTTRLLGRGGYMSVTLVSDPKNLDRDIQSFKTALKGYEFNPGERYSEFTSGDKIAAYGLGALVMGGAAAAVASKGGFKYLWYLVMAGFAAVASFFKKLFTKK